MEEQFIKSIKEKLLAQKDQLEKELGDVAERDPRAPGHFEPTFPNYGDEEEQNVSEVGAFTTNLSLGKILTSSLRDVKNALKRIKDGQYGICKYCGEEIDKARLEARPASSACVTCKQKLTQER